VKISCTQCGAEQVVLESNFFLRCPYCDARIIVDPPENTPALVEPAVSEEYVRRLFSSGVVSSVEVKFFPYLEKVLSSGREIQSCFSQPWQELEDYIDMAEESGSRVIFHPFYVVMLKLEGYGEGLLVDGVSGKIIGEPPVIEEQNDSGQNLYRTFLITLAAGLIFTVPIYFLTKDFDESWLSWIWTFILIVPLTLAFYHFKIKAGRR
jgi:DNA-directed RNA polymerase subunit RPC12/RpoP